MKFNLSRDVSEDFVLVVDLLDDLLHVSSDVGLRRHLDLDELDTQISGNQKGLQQKQKFQNVNKQAFEVDIYDLI